MRNIVHDFFMGIICVLFVLSMVGILVLPEVLEIWENGSSSLMPLSSLEYEDSGGHYNDLSSAVNDDKSSSLSTNVVCAGIFMPD